MVCLYSEKKLIIVSQSSNEVEPFCRANTHLSCNMSNVVLCVPAIATVYLTNLLCSAYETVWCSFVDVCLRAPQVSFRYHCQLYSEWRRTNQKVRLLMPEIKGAHSTQHSVPTKSTKKMTDETIVWAPWSHLKKCNISWTSALVDHSGDYFSIISIIWNTWAQILTITSGFGTCWTRGMKCHWCHRWIMNTGLENQDTNGRTQLM